MQQTIRIVKSRYVMDALEDGRTFAAFDLVRQRGVASL
jgi:hypothetical protein